MTSSTQRASQDASGSRSAAGIAPYQLSGDGQYVLFSINDHYWNGAATVGNFTDAIYLKDLDSGQLTLLTDKAGVSLDDVQGLDRSTTAFGPDGTVYFTDLNRTLYRYDIGSGAKAVIYELSYVGADRYTYYRPAAVLDTTPSGAVLIVVAVDKYGYGSTLGYGSQPDVHVMDASGSNPRAFSAEARADWSTYRLSDNGRYVVGQEASESTHKGTFFHDTIAGTTLSVGVSAPAGSRDNPAHLITIDSIGRVYFSDEDEIGPKQVSGSGTYVYDPHTEMYSTLLTGGRYALVDVSADGEYLLLEQQGLGFTAVYVARRDSPTQTSRVELGVDGKVHDKWGNYGKAIDISDDGTRILFSSYRADLVVSDTPNTEDFFVALNPLVPGIFQTVRSSVTAMLGSADRNLVLSGQGNIDGTGNRLSNVIKGNVGANHLAGLDGNDRLGGGAGADTLKGGNGNDTLEGDVGDDLLVGGAGADRLDGGGWRDTMQGGAGDDTYFVDQPSDVVDESAGAGGGRDVIYFSRAWNSLPANIEDGVLLAGANVLPGNELNNKLTGNDDDNFIFAADGNDSVYAMGGNDFVDGENGDDLVVAGDGNDHAIGGGGNDTLRGGAGDDRIDGGGGSDLLEGGSGNDTYLVDSLRDVVRDTGGADTVLALIDYVLGVSFENLMLADPTDGSAPAPLRGTGNALANRLTGNSGDNQLNGKGGVDTYVASAGNDTYMLDSVAERIELVGSGSNADAASDPGIDTVVLGLAASPYLDLSDKAWLENVTLVGTLALNVTGNLAANILIGNAAINSLAGGGGDDFLDGGAGNDTLAGGLGNDTYVLSAPGDQIVETGGLDTVKAPFAFSLASRPEIENLMLLGTANVNASGNDATNVIVGNPGANILSGGGGNDELRGNAGNDVLDGGNGIDAMDGGAGNDTYLVDVAGDLVIEAISGAVGGIDLVKSNAAQFILSQNVENLILMGTGDTNGTGNGLANRLSGNTGNNTLDGGAGADTMAGAAGNDTYVVDAPGDSVLEAREGLAGGVDLVRAAVSWVLGNNVENLALTGTNSIVGQGNSLANLITGNEAPNLLTGNAGNDSLIGGAGNDTLDGGLGADRLVGGLGDDSYVVNSVSDRIVETAGEGTDTVRVLYSTTSPTVVVLGVDFVNVENLTVSGSGPFRLTGDANANVLVGNGAPNRLVGLGGNDWLDGGLGSDTLDGGAGNDTYVVNTSLDIIEHDLSGTDTVRSAVTYSLLARVDLENVGLVGSGAINAAGNASANRLTGNAGANQLDGGGGNDTLDGLEGNDKLDGGEGNDTLTGGAGVDRLTGGAGSDRFVFTHLGARNADTVTDFSVSDDRVVLSLSAFLTLGSPGLLLAGKFAGGAGLTGAVDADDRVVYDTSSGRLYYDADGLGGTLAVPIVTFIGAPTISAAQLELVA